MLKFFKLIQGLVIFLWVSWYYVLIVFGIALVVYSAFSGGWGGSDALEEIPWHKQIR